jgi:ATP-dependent Clp protease ATP-binding subunit ClpC
MWDRFTERARRVVYFAQEEAGMRGQSFVSTEHLLLGLIRESDSVACGLLDSMNISLARVRAEVEKSAPRGEGKLSQEMQLTPRAKRVIDLAYGEARELKSNYIGTEHLLLGLVREGEGIAARVLEALGVELEPLRERVRSLQQGDVTPRQEAASRRARHRGETEIVAVEGEKGESLSDVAARANEAVGSKVREGWEIKAAGLSSDEGIHRIVIVLSRQ